MGNFSTLSSPKRGGKGAKQSEMIEAMISKQDRMRVQDPPQNNNNHNRNNMNKTVKKSNKNKNKSKNNKSSQNKTKKRDKLKKQSKAMMDEALSPSMESKLADLFAFESGLK